MFFPLSCKILAAAAAAFIADVLHSAEHTDNDLIAGELVRGRRGPLHPEVSQKCSAQPLHPSSSVTAVFFAQSAGTSAEGAWCAVAWGIWEQDGSLQPVGGGAFFRTKGHCHSVIQEQKKRVYDHVV